MKSKVKVNSSLAKTPPLKSNLLSSRPSKDTGKALKAFNGKTLAELLAEGSDGEAETPKETPAESEEDLLSLDQLLKKNKSKRKAREAELDSAPVRHLKKKAPAFDPSPVEIDISDEEDLPSTKRKAVDLLDLLKSDEEVDELAGDSELDEPIALRAPKRQPSRKPNKSVNKSIIKPKESLQEVPQAIAREQPTPHSPLFRPPSPTSPRSPEAPDHNAAMTAERSTDPHKMDTDGSDETPAEPQLQEKEREVDVEEAAVLDSEEEDFEQWLQSSVVVKS